MTRSRAIVAVGVALIGCACATGAAGPSLSTRAGASPRPIDELSVDERLLMLDRAQVWQPIDTADLDLLAGPRASDAIPFNASVTCAFDFPDKPLSGVTPKFECRLAGDDVVKVKYGEDNGEVFAEVAATRLFWALGFIVDRMYPVRVTCTNCPSDPFLVSSAEWRLGRPASGRTIVFDPATIERQLAGDEIEVSGYSGWSWRELERIADNRLGATRAHVDALKLLAVFVQHVDSKPEQQAIICPPGATTRDGQGDASCSRPLLQVKDLGSTFGAARKFKYDKMKLESWRSTPIWKDTATCEGDLTKSLIGTLEHPVISEAGRSLLAARLSLLSDAQLRDLFSAARADRRGETINGRPVTVNDWVSAFKEKRDQIVKQRCPSSTT